MKELKSWIETNDRLKELKMKKAEARKMTERKKMREAGRKYANIYTFLSSHFSFSIVYFSFFRAIEFRRMSSAN